MDDFQERDISQSEIADIADEGAAHAAAALRACLEVSVSAVTR
jgi:hypothetical protein